ncbi:hypothetical protein C4D60_Mb08t15300 [Musa balbisiana]|uniref:Uncharacterized protein n=1 Tax=Musa balbisiana TaxID=52838 RepID=A0A4S8K3Z3_MUSBA|nr:hypothetical protein C4D60_Mb08t15300 [Musa balbisiana]
MTVTCVSMNRRAQSQLLLLVVCCLGLKTAITMVRKAKDQSPCNLIESVRENRLVEALTQDPTSNFSVNT